MHAKGLCPVLGVVVGHLMPALMMAHSTEKPTAAPRMTSKPDICGCNRSNRVKNWLPQPYNWAVGSWEGQQPLQSMGHSF